MIYLLVTLNHTGGQNLEKRTEPIKNRHRLMMFLLGLLILITIVAVVVSSMMIFNRTTRNYREQIITSVSKLSAGRIDGDKIQTWLQNGADDDYIQTGILLESILENTPYLQYLYVYQIKSDGCHVVFDFETTDENLTEYDERPDISSESLGTVIVFDDSFKEYLPTLLSGGRIDTIESNDTYGWLLTKYEPIFDSNGKCVAYVGADMSMKGVYDYVKTYFAQIVVISTIFFTGCILIGVCLYMGARRADEMDNLIKQQKRDKELTREIIEAFAKVTT